MKVAIIAIDYGDGLRRKLGAGGYILFKGKRLPLVGAISTDSCAIDISELCGQIKLGDYVTVLGKNETERITVEDWAKKDGTIPYEMLTSIARLARLIV